MFLHLFSLSNRVALVTGASTGLGQGMALALASAGADIVSLGRRPNDETGEQVTALGRRFMHVPCDLAEAAVSDLQDVLAHVQSEMGQLDILVNNAGIIRRSPAIDFTETDWDAVLQVNLKAVFFLSQAAARQMVTQGGGKIIQIASMLSYQGGIMVPAYTAAKSALAGVTHALANEWAKHNINVNAIAPGYMATDNTAALQADPVRNKAILDRIPAGRWGTPGDLAGAVIFLASKASDYMHGTILAVDGGWLSR